jgi:hypothetical protein
MQKKIESPMKIDANHQKLLFERLFKEGAKELKKETA